MTEGIREDLHPAAQWAIALGLFLLALAVRWWVLPADAGSAFLTFYPATIAAFYFLDARPAMLAWVLSALAGYYFFSPPLFSFAPSVQSVLHTTLFLLTSGAVGWIVDRLRQSSAEQRAAVLREQASREELDAILSAQTEVLGRVAADGTLLYVNDAYCRQLGVRREEVLGTRWQPRVLPEDLPEVERQLQQLSPRQPDVTIENRLLMADGRVRWYQFANHAEFDREGRITLIQAVGRDITERRSLQDALARKSAELRDLFDNAPCGYHALDPEGRFVVVNTVESRWLGRPAAELVRQRRLGEFLGDEDRARFASHHAAALAGRPTEPVEVDLVHTGQPPRRVSISTEAGLDESGRFMHTRGVMHDVTDLHQARQAAQRLLAEQTAMLQTELIGIARLRGRQVVWNNRTLERMFGYDAGALRDAPSQLLYVDEASHERLGREIDAEISAGRSFRAQLEMRRRDGSRLWVDAMGAPFDAERRETLWLLLDITQQKQAEQVRIQAAALEAENRQLRELGRVQGEFVAKVSHEMRTPLNAIIGLAHLLQREDGSADAAQRGQYANNVYASAVQLLGMVNRVLEYVRTASGRMDLELQDVDVAQLLGQVRDTGQALARERGLQLALQAPAAPLVVAADRMRLMQVLQGLLDNAIKFTPPPGRVELCALGPDAGWVRIEVCDSGVGIAPQEQQRIFEGFHAPAPGAPHRAGGLGLGLALARRIVHAHGGRIELQSAPGQGSRFAVLLPAAEAAA